MCLVRDNIQNMQTTSKIQQRKGNPTQRRIDISPKNMANKHRNFIQMTNKHIKRRSGSLILRETHIERTVRGATEVPPHSR